MVAVNYDWDELEDNIDEEYDDAGATIAEYTTEPALYGNVISQRRSGQSNFLHCDGLGSTLALTNAAGTVTDTNAYSAFGEVTEHSGSTTNPLQYVGQYGYYKDEVTGEYMVRRRLLSAPRGTWMTVDPAETLDSTFKLQGYRYCDGRSPTCIDPSGLLASLGINISIVDKYVSKDCSTNPDGTPKEVTVLGDKYKEPIAIRYYKIALSNAAPCTGYLVFKVSVQCDVADCACGCPQTIPSEGFYYVETFRTVAKGSFTSPDQQPGPKGYLDAGSYGALLNSCGSYTQKVEMRFYCRLKDWDAGALPRETPVIGDDIKKDIVDKKGNREGWRAGGDKQLVVAGKSKHCTVSIANAFYKPDNEPQFWKDTKGIATPAFRSFAVSYDCCAPASKFAATFKEESSK